MSPSLDRRGGRDRDRPTHPYPRTARVNAVITQIVASALERASDDDERLGLLTVTGARTDPDLRRAIVFFASLPPEAAVALGDHRARLQAAIARSARLKRTPLLEFLPDPAIAAGERVENALRRAHERDE